MASSPQRGNPVLTADRFARYHKGIRERQAAIAREAAVWCRWAKAGSLAFLAVLPITGLATLVCLLGPRAAQVTAQWINYAAVALGAASMALYWFAMGQVLKRHSRHHACTRAAWDLAEQIALTHKPTR